MHEQNANSKLDWQAIETVLLDMDGTILDLRFDNFFWQEHLPQIYAEKNQLSLLASKQLLAENYGELEGTLNWYCLDYWSERLQLDIVGLKQSLSEKVAFRPFAVEFLQFLKRINKRVILVTNAHPKSLEIKLLAQEFSQYFDHLSSSHEFGFPKEQQEYWHRLKQKFGFNPTTTLFVDDSVKILKSAQQFGIQYLRAISQPDSQKQPIDSEPFVAIHHFSDVIV